MERAFHDFQYGDRDGGDGDLGPAADRHGTPVELFRFWIGANINYVTVVAGSLIYAAGLSIHQCLTAILVGNVLGCTVVGLCSIMGPRTGSAGIITSRTGNMDFDRFPVGRRLKILPNHACATAAAYERYHVTDGSDHIVDVWERVNGW